MNISKQSRLLPFIVLGSALLLNPGAIFGQTTIHVPKDFPTIQGAIDGANSGDTILVAEGRWCGAIVSKAVNLVGVDDDTTIIACPNEAGPVGLKRGLFMQAGASGSSVSNFVFDGAGYSDGNRTPLALGIGSNVNANDITVEHNRFLGGLIGVNANGTGWNVSHNVFDGFTLLNPPDCLGGVAIASSASGLAPLKSVFNHNKITSQVPEGTSPACSFLTEIDVPMGGIVISGHDGTTISQNKISITPNLHGDAAAGIVVSDQLLGSAGSLVSANLVITDNDARGSTFGVVVTTGNAQGDVIRDNKGNNLISGATGSTVSHSMKSCDGETPCQ